MLASSGYSEVVILSRTGQKWGGELPRPEIRGNFLLIRSLVVVAGESSLHAFLDPPTHFLPVGNDPTPCQGKLLQIRALSCKSRCEAHARFLWTHSPISRRRAPAPYKPG